MDPLKYDTIITVRQRLFEDDSTKPMDEDDFAESIDEANEDVVVDSHANSTENGDNGKVNIAAEFEEEHHSSTHVAQDPIGTVMDDQVDIAGPGLVGLLVEAFEEV